MPANSQTDYNRHRSFPEPDGGIVWYRNPVFTRDDWYRMIIAVRALIVPEIREISA